MKVFLINLKKNPERLKKSTSQLESLGVEFERIEGVYGKDLSQHDKDLSVNRFRWWCAQGRKIRDGEIGCALSHYGIYQKMIDEQLDCACILEDDNKYNKQFKDVIERLESLVDINKPQVVLLSNYTGIELRSDEICIKSTNRDITTSSYVITRYAAESILRANYPICVPCDYWVRWVSRGLIQLYHSIPTVCMQEGRNVGGGKDSHFTSDVEEANMERVSEFGFCRFVFHKLKRIIGVAIDKCLPV